MIKLRVTTVLWALCITTVAVAAQEHVEVPRAIIVTDGGSDDSPRIQSIEATVRSTLDFSLALSGTVELVEQPDVAELLFAIEIAEDDGRFNLTAEKVSLIDESRETISERSAESIFDIFPVVDALTLDIVRAVGSSDVAFGTILIDNRGFSVTYDVRIDNVAVGSDVTRIDRVLTGERTVSIVGAVDDEIVTYHVAEVQITEDAPAKVSFWLPPYSPIVVDRIRDWHRGVRAPVVGEPVPPDSPTLDEILTRAPGILERLEETSDNLTQRRSRRSRFSGEMRERLMRAELTRTPESIGYRTTPTASPAQRIVPVIPPVPENGLSAWRWQVVGARETPPIAIDPPGDSESDRDGTDFHEVYARRSESGIHILVSFHDGSPDPSNGHYRIGFATEHVSNGLIEVMWRNESGRPEAVVAVVNPQRWNVLDTFPAPTEYLDGAIAFTLPHAALDLARSRAKGLGWEFDAALEAAEGGDYRNDDSIALREPRLYF